MVVGIAGVFKEKAWLEIEMLLTVIEAEPLFDSVIDSVLLVPVVTLPNASTLPPMLSVLVAACTVDVRLELNPMQPTIIPRQSAMRASNPARLRFMSTIVSKHGLRRSAAKARAKGGSTGAFIYPV